MPSEQELKAFLENCGKDVNLIDSTDEDVLDLFRLLANALAERGLVRTGTIHQWNGQEIEAVIFV